MEIVFQFEKAMDFLNHQNETNPFFMFLSPPAPHGPFTPFPPYQNNFYNLSAPRTPNFGISVEEVSLIYSYIYC